MNKDSKKLLSNRILLSKEGFVLLMILIDSKRNEIFWCNISTRGSFYAKDAIFAIKKINALIKKELNTFIKENKIHFNDPRFCEFAKNICGNLIWKFMKKNPLIKINIWDNLELLKVIDAKDYVEPILNNESLNINDNDEFLQKESIE